MCGENQTAASPVKAAEENARQYKIRFTGFSKEGERIPRCVTQTGADMQRFLDQCSYEDWFDVAWMGDGKMGKRIEELRWDDPRTAAISIGNLYKGDDDGGIGVLYEIVLAEDADD